MNSRSIAIFAIVIAAVIGGALWYLSGENAPHAVQNVETPEPITRPSATPSPEAPKITRVVPKDTTPEVKPEPATPAPAPAAMTEDDRKIDEVLRLFPNDNSDLANTNTAQALINLLPTLTKDGQEECAQHICNLLSDEEYKRLLPMWRNPGINSDVLEVFATDLMNRDDTVKLPAMLDAAKIPNHPYHEEALVNLQIFLDGDYGTDWPKWDKAMKEYLAKQAAENADTPTPLAPK
jgi:hypothetical protein